MKKTLITLLIGLAPNAFAYTGNELLSALRSSSPETRLSAIIYVGVFVEGFQTAENFYKGRVEPTICTPASVTRWQSADIVKNHLERSPETRHIEAAYHVILAMREVFPCAQK